MRIFDRPARLLLRAFAFAGRDGVFFPELDFAADFFLEEVFVVRLGFFFLAGVFFFEDDFFRVTFFLESFRLDFDLPALAVFFVFFLLVFFLRDGAFLADFFALDLRTAFALVFFFETFFFEAFFFALVFLAAIRVCPGWLKMQPAIIHRSFGSGSLRSPSLQASANHGNSTRSGAFQSAARCSATTVV